MTEHANEDFLPLGAWDPEIHTALVDNITRHGITSPGYDPERPPLALIDCDGGLMYHELGEAMMRYLITRRHLNTDRGFWSALIPDRMGRDALSAAHKAVAGRNDAEVRDTAAFRRYRAGMFGVYESLRQSEDPGAASLFAARVLRGLHERTVADLVEEVLDYELDRPLSTEDIAAGPPFSAISVPSGIRVYHEMLGLLQALETYGFSTWLIGSANIYVMRALARRIGFPEERVLGLELQTQSGRYTDRPVEQVPIGEDKLELYLDVVGRSPLIAVGASANDYDFLENCEGVSILVDQGDDDVIAYAQEKGWFVQGPLTV
jgi:phosphoserine phosphatase